VDFYPALQYGFISNWLRKIQLTNFRMNILYLVYHPRNIFVLLYFTRLSIQTKLADGYINVALATAHFLRYI